MSERKIAKSWGVGCIRQTLLVIVAFLVLLTGFMALVLLSTILPLTADQRTYLWLGGTLFLFFLIGIGIFIWSNRLIHGRTIRLDAAFAPLGLAGKGFALNGRQYHGVIDNRHVDIYFYRGPTLDIYLSASINTRMGIGLKGSHHRMASSLLHHPEMLMADPELSHFGFYPLDEAWGRALLEAPVSKQVVLRLMAAAPGLEFRNLVFQPEAVHLQINRINLADITGDKVSAWLNDLISLAVIAESLPTPHSMVTASSMERRARLSRSDFTLPLVGLTCGIIGFLTAIFIILLVFFINLGKGGF